MRTHRAIVAAVLGSAALAGPAAAMPVDPPLGPVPPPEVQTAPTAAKAPTGFDWSSAAVGAAGGVGACAIALAAGAGMRRRPQRPQRIVTH